MQNAHTTPRSSFLGKLAVRFYHDPRLIALTLLLITASGLSSLWVLPRLEDPQLTGRAANITTVFPGADAERVESLVTEPIEDKLLDVPEIKRIRSQSRAGVSFIAIELRDEISEPKPVWSDIRGKMEDAISELPSGASRPQFDELDIAAYAWIGAITWDGEDAPPLGIMRRLARQLKDELLAVTGTKSVDLYGDPGEEILVEIEPDRAAVAGISPIEVARQLSRGDVKNAVGLIRDERTETIVELTNEFKTLDDILNGNLQSGKPGTTLRLLDVATVHRETPDPIAAKAIIDGRPAVVVSVMLRPDYRIDQWAESAAAVVDDFRARLPQGVDLDVIMQQSVYVAERMNNLAWNLCMGVGAVGLMTLLFMGWRSSLLVTATLPIASLMVIAGMRVLGIPIHQMSVTGLVIALGLLIDNAIIATDEIGMGRRRGLSAANSVLDMVSRLAAPLLASSLTTIFAFAPIALMEGPAGEFVGAIAITVMLAIVSSLVLSVTILPAAAALLLHREANEQANEQDRHSPRGRFWRHLWKHGASLPAVSELYRRLLRGMLARPWLGVAVGCILPLLGFVSATQLSEQFFPPTDRNQFHIEVELGPQAAMAETERLVRQLDGVLENHPRVRFTSWFLGESAPPFYYNIIARRKNNPNYAHAIVTIDNNRQTVPMIRDLQLALDRQFPEARILVRQLEQGPPFEAPLEIRIFGSDLDQLQEYGERFRELAARVPTALHVRTALNDIRPVAAVKVDARQASWSGLTETDIANQLFSRLEGLYAGSIVEQVEQIPVRVRIAGRNRAAIEDLGQTSLLLQNSNPSADGASGDSETTDSLVVTSTVPVSSLASIQLKPQRAVITRYNGRRMVDVQGFLVAGTLPSAALAAFQTELRQSDLNLAPGYFVEFGGEASERNDAVGRLMANVSVLIVGMVGALVLSLSSFRFATLIGIVAALSVGLGLGALWLFGYPFGFMAIIGTMGLIGVAVNDSIVVTAALKDNAAVRQGDIEATVDTIVDVTRHVLATTLTTAAGFLPLLLSGGAFWPPLAVAIGAGVVGATFIALTLVPCAVRLMTIKRSICVTADEPSVGEFAATSA
jgi:multidrug efflux pump subunit AcrB